MTRYFGSYSSHMPVLLKIMSLTSGPVLEMGVGVCSTIILHYLCMGAGRQLISYENNEKYTRGLMQFHGGFHEIKVVDNWDAIDILKPWSVAFIDHAPMERRKVDAGRLANYAEYVICHDSEPKHDRYYKYSEIYPLFKYRYNYEKLFPHTVVLSNFHCFGASFEI
mgnify:CR=1 FL=1